ncbi:hypothetical protein ACT3CD_15650 [Geofilum sp. OHC36d9]|uniref:hypothetical protein n=1 Tax=Geofilum sp. OHC36d9 TaxID=3458413 RepID=UPI0040334961
MKQLIVGILCLTGFSLQAQVTFFIDDDISFPDFSIGIGDDISFPDIKIEIGSEVSFEDFTVGVTSDKNQAQFIISKSQYSDYTVRADDDIPFPDLRILAGDDVSFPDVTIKLQKSGTVDYLVYTEKDFMTLADMVIALLPVINHETKFDCEKINNLFHE